MRAKLRAALNDFFENRISRKPIATDPTEDVLNIIMPIIDPQKAIEEQLPSVDTKLSELAHE
jgi:hypothetical protein